MDLESAKYITVLVTCPVDKAPDLAGELVKARLAACVNIINGVRSIYTWKGELCDDAEALLVVKSRAELFKALRARVVELHPYDVPEVIALPIAAGHAPYLDWLEESTR
jgi:periplasmic divalent cation tolerance protein